MNLANLKKEGTDAIKVNIWLDHINEHDPAQRAEVLQQCRDVPESRTYFLMRYEQDCTA